jgi:hypothetical protein
METTFAKINYEIENKEYVLQHIKDGWRCISWHPHYIMTDWVKAKEIAISNGDIAIEKYYDKIVQGE